MKRGRWRMKWGGGDEEEEVGGGGGGGAWAGGGGRGREESAWSHQLCYNNCLANITTSQTHKRRHSPIASMSIMNGTALLFPTALMDTIIASYTTFGTSPQISIVVSLPNAVSITVTGVELVELGRVKVMIN